MKLSKIRTITSLGLALSLAAVNAYAYKGQELAGQTKISMEQARATALKIHPGKIIEEGLEREKGRLRYSFDIRDGKVTHEVSLDAETGNIEEQ